MKPYPAVPEGLVVTRDDGAGVLHVRFDRRDRRNALTDPIVYALVDTIDAAGSDESVRVVEICGAGDDFCSGFDLADRRSAAGAGAGGGADRKPRITSIHRRMHAHVNRLIPAMLECQTPIVCAVRGWCIGLGLDIALAADFTVVADDARLWAPFTTFGFTPDSGASWLLPRLAGVARAKEMLLLGEQVSGTDAASWGLVHRAVPGDELDATADALVERLAHAPTVAVGLTKLLIHRGLTADLARHLHDEAWAMEVSSRSDDFKEYGAAAKQRRDPDYRGR
jgi:2-(1,2-epoxy-1,2-dihydrophenyl)acetyl-CoA isomerase